MQSSWLALLIVEGSFDFFNSSEFSLTEFSQFLHIIFTTTGKANHSALQASSRRAKFLDFFFLDAKFLQFIGKYNFTGENPKKGQHGAQVSFHPTGSAIFVYKKLWLVTCLYSVQKVIVQRN